MAKVQGSPEALNQMASQIKRVIQQETQAAQALQSAYRAAGSEWNDSKYQQLGGVISQAVSAIKAPISELESAVQKIKKMEQDLRAYLDN